MAGEKRVTLSERGGVVRLQDAAADLAAEHRVRVGRRSGGSALLRPGQFTLDGIPPAGREGA